MVENQKDNQGQQGQGGQQKQGNQYGNQKNQGGQKKEGNPSEKSFTAEEKDQDETPGSKLKDEQKGNARLGADEAEDESTDSEDEKSSNY